MPTGVQVVVTFSLQFYFSAKTKWQSALVYKKIADIWKNMPKQERLPWTQKAELDKARSVICYSCIRVFLELTSFSDSFSREQETGSYQQRNHHSKKRKRGGQRPQVCLYSMLKLACSVLGGECNVMLS
jgi:hypothetical protein